MPNFQSITETLRSEPKTWMVTGAAGFIGSHLVETLLKIGQNVLALDSFVTGSRGNLEAARAIVGEEAWRRFSFHQADICDADSVTKIFGSKKVDVVLHQAALGSVPRSMEEPKISFESNVTGFANVLDAARLAGVGRFVYASSSSVYGDDTSDKKVEELTGTVLSPYAATKAMNEVWAASYAKAYGTECVGLRYFNVFGPRQDPNGPYAAVVARWITGAARRERCFVNGDGSTSRDFCYVANVVQANILAGVNALSANPSIFNVACGATTTLLQLWDGIQAAVKEVLGNDFVAGELDFQPFRAGDILHSLANITKVQRSLGYEPTHDVRAGLVETARWALAAN